MAIQLAEKYSAKVDERFAKESKSDRVVNKDYDFVGVQTVKIYSVGTSAMGDYTRTGANRYGTPAELDTTLQEMTMSQDRAFTFTVDKMNEDETMNALNVGKALSRQLREIVMPEIDTYRYTVMATRAGTKATPAAITSANIYELITKATEVLDENSVPSGRFIVVTPQTYMALKQSKDVILETNVGQEMRLKGIVAQIDGMDIIKMPSSSLPTNFGFLVGHSIATVAPVKLSDYKIHKDAPGISGSLVEGRFYYDAFVLNNKINALYLHNIA